MATEPIKRECRYVNGNLKRWKERIKTNFHDQDVPYNMHCNATAVLKIDSIYRQVENYDPQVYVKACKHTDAENQQCSMLSDDGNDDDEFFVVEKEGEKVFCNLPRFIKLIKMNKTSLLELARKLNTPRQNCMKTKEQLEDAIKDTITRYKEIIFNSDTPTCMACLDEPRKQQAIDQYVHNQKLKGDKKRKIV